MINALELYRKIAGEYQKTSQPLKERASVLPLGQYEDGSVGLAWPSILAAPAEGVMNFGSQGYGEDAVPYNSRMAFDAAGGAMTGGLGVGLAGGMADNALGSAGAKLTQSASDLPMDLASRMARAKEMGFDIDKTWYHGSTHDFMEFDPARGNPEGHLGAGAYFTSSPKDAWKNYGPDGPDLTNRVEQIAERLVDDLGGDMDAARQHARQQIAGQSDGAIYPVMLRGKTLDLRGSTRGNPTALEMQYGPSPDEFMDVARKELGADADKWDLYDRARELADEASADATPTGELWNFLESIRRQSGDYGFDADEVLSSLDDILGDGVGAADDIDRRLRNSPLMYAEHPETGSLIGNDVIRQAFNDAGYPNIVMDAKAAFPSMPNIDPGTLHMIVSDPRNIRSVNAAFDPAKSDSANLLAANAPSSASVPLAMNALERAQPQGIRAYHGSPHDFDRFSLDAIGTGEGAQAYGHGLYFAQSEDVARNYRDILSQNTYIDGQPVNAANAPFKWMSSYYRDGMTDARDIEKALLNDIDVETKRAAELEQSARSGPKSSRGFAQNYAKEARSRAAAKQTQLSELQEHLRTNPGAIANNVQGRMYEVNIKANPEDFLDWDKPLSQQSEAVRQAVAQLTGRKVDPQEVRAFDDALLAALSDDGPTTLPRQPSDPTGSFLYNQYGTGKAGSTQALREAGIPGIKYLDGMSRDGGAGTSNYVVFDDQLIDILRKYANAPTGAAIPLGMEGQQDTDPALLEYLRLTGQLPY